MKYQPHPSVIDCASEALCTTSIPGTQRLDGRVGKKGLRIQWEATPAHAPKTRREVSNCVENTRGHKHTRTLFCRAFIGSIISNTRRWCHTDIGQFDLPDLLIRSDSWDAYFSPKHHIEDRAVPRRTLAQSELNGEPSSEIVVKNLPRSISALPVEPERLCGCLSVGKSKTLRPQLTSWCSTTVLKYRRIPTCNTHFEVSYDTNVVWV